jgi:hypothetical protein
MATADTNAEQQFEVESIWTGVGVAVVSPSGPDILLDPDGTDPRNKLATGPASGGSNCYPIEVYPRRLTKSVHFFMFLYISRAAGRHLT